MPSKSPDGKRLSGAAQRKVKQRRVEHERTREQTGGAFDALPVPPLDATASLITWGARALALTLHRAMSDPTIFETERDQLRFIADGCAKLGMIRDKAAEQESIKRTLAEVKKEKETAGLTDARGRSTPRVPRPPG